ncbi:hypothetical protein PPERSA_02045 [Pseudocohnilembus persalinus]|uniref:Uncharacterized protein n=1 Tax=Pseudocohnilembus persalinus TaxID=266149 RepID=A0A0V0QF73_PSEPJ|nr:hypothetical protein PPERSA_02045 [Pseudocohnilembus persalinus]|eukprot:KRX00866.1 hypothetical protein PPERSA_02045 [Pseudocohnilembus persalinus]
MEPNLATFLFEADLEKYLRMADTIEAIFEALPLSIIQYINNELRGQSWDLISILSFGSSILTVFIYCVSLVQFLFQDDAETLWDQWTEMEKLKKQGKYLYHIYELPKKLTITAKRELLKLQHVSIKGLQKVKHLIVDLYKQSNESDSIISALKHLFPKTDCQTISLRMGECNMNFEHYQSLISNATTLKCEQFEMDLSDNFKMLHTGLGDDITLQIVKHDPIIKKLKDKDVATIDLVKENEKDFQRLTFYKFKALYVNCGIRFNDLLIMFKGLAPNLFITDFELNISNNQIFNQDLRNLDHDAISDFDVIENLDINFSDNFLEEQGIQILLELILLNFPSLSQLKIDFSNQKRSIFLSNLQGKPRINKTYKKGEVLYYEGKTFTKQELQNFQKYTVKKFNPINNSQVTLLEKMLSQSSKYYSQWNDFNFQEIPANFPLKEKLDNLQLNLSNASISDYSLMQISQQLIGCHLNQLQTFELNLSQNPLGNQGIQYLAQYGFSKMEQAVHISVQLDELSYQFKNKIDLSGIIAFSDYLPRQIQKFTISAKQNEKMADTIFATDEICFSLSEKDIKLLEEDKNAKNPIPEQIRQLCKFNQDLISLQVVSNPSSDSEVPVSFRLNQKYIINLAKKMLLRPHLFSKQNVKQNFIQVTQIQDISQSINEFEQGLLIGRLNQAFAPPISFAQIDNSVSKKSALITKNEKGKYQIKCLSSASNPVSIRLQKGIKYQIFEKARIQVDRSYSSIQIDIQGLGQNDYLTESDKEFHPEIQSWSFLSKQTKTLQQLEEEEEELDSDRTINEDEMMIAPVKVEKKPQLPKSQISFSVKNLWTSGKNYFTFDLDPKKQEENEQENSLVQNKISDFGKEEEEQILKHSSQNMLNKQPKKAKAKISQTNKLKGGTEQSPQLVNLSIFDKQKIKFGADENITNFPLKTVESQTQVERIHFIIGKEKLGEKQIWYIKLDDDYHNDLSKVSETFLNLKKFDEPEQSENFDIYDNMQFNVGFTVMGLNLLGANSQEFIEKKRNKQLELKQSESSHVINLKIPNQ